MPLPIFDATTITSFDSTLPPAGTAPAAGTASYGPSHNLDAQTFQVGSPNNPPTITTNGPGNTVAFDFGTFDAAPPSAPVFVDVLFTVQVLDIPFADGLFLTNQAQSSFGTTGGVLSSNTEIAQIVVNEPEMVLSKGVVATDNPAATFDAATGSVTFNPPGVCQSVHRHTE